MLYGKFRGRFGSTASGKNTPPAPCPHSWRTRSGTQPACRPVWDILQPQIESLCAAFRLHEDDPVAERGMLGSQQTQNGVTSKDNTVFRALLRAHERKGHLNICPSNGRSPSVPSLFFLFVWVFFAPFWLSFLDQEMLLGEPVVTRW